MTKQNDETFALDLHNRVTGEELEKLLKMQLTALAENPEMAMIASMARTLPFS